MVLSSMVVGQGAASGQWLVEHAVRGGARQDGGVPPLEVGPVRMRLGQVQPAVGFASEGDVGHAEMVTLYPRVVGEVLIQQVQQGLGG
jgi:hypothetical protein